MNKKQLVRMLERLREVRQISTMETSCFGNSKAETEQIKEKTELWRESWIIHPLDVTIKELEEELIRRFK